MSTAASRAESDRAVGAAAAVKRAERSVDDLQDSAAIPYKAGTSRSASIGLARVVSGFVCSRCVFSLTAIGVAIACRVMIPKPFRWYEVTAAAALLLLWPRLELVVHTIMHEATWTGSYRRHKLHHEDKMPLEAMQTYLLYNVMPLPWLAIHWACAETVTIALLFAIAVYEFVHHSVHVRYRPRTLWGQSVRRNHLLHHRDPTTRLELVFPKA
jgi:hypothetical protein